MLSLGDTLTFGLFSGDDGVPTPIEWVVLKTHEGFARVIAKKAEMFKHTYENNVRWRDSKLRQWLNDSVYNSIFTDKEKDCIIDTIVKDDECYKVVCDNEADPYIDGCRPVSMESLVTRDKIAIPQMRDISEVGYKDFNGEMLIVYKLKADTSKIVCDLWKSRDDIAVIDTFQCRKRDWCVDDYRDPRAYYNLGNYHGTVHWTIPYDSKEPELECGYHVGYGSSSAVAYVNPMVWIDIHKYESL